MYIFQLIIKQDTLICQKEEFLQRKWPNVRRNLQKQKQ